MKLQLQLFVLYLLLKFRKYVCKLVAKSVVNTFLNARSFVCVSFKYMMFACVWQVTLKPWMRLKNGTMLLSAIADQVDHSWPGSWLIQYSVGNTLLCNICKKSRSVAVLFCYMCDRLYTRYYKLSYNYFPMSRYYVCCAAC
jgi:hypothetical protein